jgi:hypothetical protein
MLLRVKTADQLKSATYFKQYIKLCMYLKLRIINPLEYRGWDESILANKKACFSRSKAWATILHETFKCKPMYFCTFCREHIDSIVPVMEMGGWINGRRGVSLPFTQYCEPITGNHFQFSDILDLILSHGEKNIKRERF